MKANTGPEGYIPGIDGLRAVAVLSVLLFHMRASLLPGGFVGVDIFFVISGYVVSASLAHRDDVRLKSYLLGFYARRIVRIFPALLVCVLVTCLVTTMLVPSSWLSETTAYAGLASIFGLSNFALVLFSDGYFSPRAEFNAFTHTWSLAVEEQFYVMFPLVFYAWFRHRGSEGAKSRAARLLLPGLLLASFAYCIYETSKRPDLAYYMLPSRFWELACGAMLFRLHHAGRVLPATATQAGMWTLAGGALIGVAFAFADKRAFPFPWAVPAVLGAALVIGGSVRDVARRAWPNAVLGSGWMTYIGKISYSLYLWHWPVLVVLRWTTGLDDAWVLVVAGVLSLGLAVASYHGVEQGQWWRKRLAGWSAWRTVTYGSAGLVLGAMCFGAILASQRWISLSVTRDARVWYPNAWPSEGSAQPAQGHALAGRRLFVLGDSHAGAYRTMLQQLQEQTGVKVSTYSRGGCGAAGLRYPADKACRAWIDAKVAEIMEKAVPGDIVFLAALRMWRLADQWEIFDAGAVVAKRPAPQAARHAQILQEADDIVTTFQRAGLLVVIDAPKPIFKSPPFRCSDWFNARNPICAGGFVIERDFLEQRRQRVMDALVQLKNRHPALTVWDPFPVLCPDKMCSAFDGALPLFLDGDHLSGHGNRVLYPSFQSMLESAAGQLAPRSAPAPS